MIRGAAIVMLVLTSTLAMPLSAQRIRLSVPLGDLEKAVRKDSTDAAAHYNVAVGYWSDKKYDRAEAELRAAIELEPRYALAYLGLSMLPFARRDELWNEVIEERVPVEWRDAVAESDRNFRLAFMINPLLDLRILGAVTPKKSVLWEVDPVLSVVYGEWLRGFDDVRQGDYAGAYLRLERLADEMRIGRTSKSMDLLPSALLWYRGLAAAHVGKYAEAIRDFEELIVRTKEDDTALTYLPLEAESYRYVLASLYRAAGRTADAVKLYHAIAEQDAGSYVSYIALGDIAQEQNDRPVELQQRERAVAANPEDVTSQIELAIALSRMARNGDAEVLLKEVTANHPRNSRAWYLLALLQEGSGQNQQARHSLERFLETVPSRFPNEIADAKRRLAALRST